MNDLTVNSVATDGLNISDNTITSTRSNDDINLVPSGTGAVNVNGAKITNLANTPTADTDAANKKYVDDQLSAISSSTISQGNSNVTVSDSGAGSITMTADGITQVTVDATSVDIGNFTFSGNKITQTASNANYEMDNSGSGNFVFIGTTGIILPKGTTAERPTAQEGVIRYNTDTSKYEVSQDGSTWTALRTEQTAREIIKDVFTGDGSTTSFQLTTTPADADNVIVYIDGVMQEPVYNYTITGNVLAFDGTAPGDSSVESPHIGARVVVIQGLAEAV